MEFLKRVLEKCSLGAVFLKWINLLYTEERVTSREISIIRGVRQGCLLSPLLFNLVIETLAIAVRSCPEISAIRVRQSIYKIALYADDTVFFLQKSLRSMRALQFILKVYSDISGYKVNENKSLV